MKKRDFLSFLLLGVILIFIYHLFGSLSSVTAFLSSLFSQVIMPVLLGFVICYILSIPVSFLEKKLIRFSRRRAISIALSLIIIIGVLTLILMLIIPQLVRSLQLLYDSAIEFSHKMQALISEKGEDETFVRYLSFAESLFTEMVTRLSDYLKTSGTRLLSTAVGSVSQIVSAAVGFFVSLMIGLYFVADRERVSSDIAKAAELFLPESVRIRASHVISIANKAFSRFITAQCLEAVILGSLCALGMVILRLPYAPMIGCLIMVTALIPIWGGLIGGLVSAFIIAVASPVKGLVFLIYLIILQQTEGNLIYPRVVGSSVGLPPVYTFLAVTVFGSFFGIAGMLMAVPVSSVIYSLLKEHYCKLCHNKDKK